MNGNGNVNGNQKKGEEVKREENKEEKKKGREEKWMGWDEMKYYLGSRSLIVKVCNHAWAWGLEPRCIRSSKAK